MVARTSDPASTRLEASGILQTFVRHEHPYRPPQTSSHLQQREGQPNIILVHPTPLLSVGYKYIPIESKMQGLFEISRGHDGSSDASGGTNIGSA